ncbi:MAG: hypothetical protein HRT89_13990, partial [Lentisphaeria bacterium]|nr:hypothetical protein [Lentisphaeria bacterium]NQZ69166.1 hypothetical protein [Lentisphaeria bacterium]
MSDNESLKDPDPYVAPGAHPFETFTSPGYRNMDSLVDDITKENPGTAKWVWILFIFLGVCFSAGVLLYSPGDGITKSLSSEREETNYEKRIKQSKLASKIANDLKGKITMPPDPPDPESVVEEAMTESMKNDVDKLMGGVDALMETKVVSKIADKVAKAMQADIKLLSKDIAEGKLSPEEISIRQAALEDKAHDTMNKELYTHRVETQTKRAKFESIRWYQDSVAPALLTTIAKQVFKGGDRIRASFPLLFNGRFGWSKYRLWSHTRSEKSLRKMGNTLRKLSNSKWDQAEWKKWKVQWARVEARNKRATKSRQKKVIPQVYYASYEEWVYFYAKENATIIRTLYEGQTRRGGTYPTPSWFNIIYGTTDEHMDNGVVYLPTVTNGLLNEYLIDQKGLRNDMLDAMADEWEDVIETALSIQEKAQDNVPLAEVHKMRQEQNTQLKAIAKKVNSLFKNSKGKRIDFNTRTRVNELLRFKVLTDEKTLDEQYNKMIEGMVAGLAELIKDFARSQFRKGILQDKGGIDAAVNKFQADIIPILKKDLQTRVCTKRFFKRAIFNAGSNKKFLDILGDLSYVPESQNDIDKTLKELEGLLAKRMDLAEFAKLREAKIRTRYDEAVNNVVDEVIMKTLLGGWLAKNLGAFVEGVDYSDKVKEKLNARESAKEGRKQDMARLTKDGVPDTALGMTALKLAGQKGHGANLLPVFTDMTPLFKAESFPMTSLKYSNYIAPKAAKKWTINEPQVAVKDIPFPYKSPIYEGIPFLAELPVFDGDLSEWVNLRPLYLKNGKGAKPVAVYAGWNYQGFFFAYHVDTKGEDFILPVNLQKGYAGVGVKKNTDIKWVYKGESLRLCFDTLDARDEIRGERHTQEFFVFPLGTSSDNAFSGVERIISSKRDAKSKQFRGVISRPREFRRQGKSPSKYAPFRITKKDKTGYSTEVFIPRT